MPESPCRDCGESVLHTQDDPYPRCERCNNINVWTSLVLDIAYGRLEVPDEVEAKEDD